MINSQRISRKTRAIFSVNAASIQQAKSFFDFDCNNQKKKMEHNNISIHQRLRQLLEKLDHKHQHTSLSFVSQIQSNLIDDINNSSLHIPEVCIPFSIKRVQLEDQNSADLLTIQEEKRRIEEKLYELKNTEKQLLQKNKSMSNSMVKSRVRSEFKEEEKQQIKNISKKYRQFQKSLKKKTQALEYKKVADIKREEQLKLQNQQCLNKVKKQQIKTRLQQLSQKDAEREKRSREDALALKKVEAKRKIHEIMEQEWEEKQRVLEKQKVKEMEIRLKDKHTNFQSLREHQKKYEQIIGERRLQETQRRMEMSRLSHNSSAQFSTSRFYYLVEEQQKKAKKMQKERQENKRALRQKQQQYSELVKSSFAPKLKSRQNQATINADELKTTQIKPKPSVEQWKKMGDENLRAGNKRTRKKKEYQENQIQCTMSLTKSRPDYLTQSRVFRQSLNPYGSPLQNPKKAAEKILANPKIQEEQKIEQLKLLASQFDCKTNNLVHKIRGKLQMLEAIR